MRTVEADVVSRLQGFRPNLEVVVGEQSLLVTREHIAQSEHSQNDKGLGDVPGKPTQGANVVVHGGLGGHDAVKDPTTFSLVPAIYDPECRIRVEAAVCVDAQQTPELDNDRV